MSSNTDFYFFRIPNRLLKSIRITRFLLWLLLFLMVLNFSQLIYFNFCTHSLPYGLYIKIIGLPRRDDFAATCLNPEIVRYGIERGYLNYGNCSTGSVLILKKIKGLPGDSFTYKSNSLVINGVSYNIMSADSSGRKLSLFYKRKQGILSQGEYILLSDFVKNSWDSRYWGPVGIEFLLKPLWVF